MEQEPPSNDDDDAEHIMCQPNSFTSEERKDEWDMRLDERSSVEILTALLSRRGLTITSDEKKKCTDWHEAGYTNEEIMRFVIQDRKKLTTMVHRNYYRGQTDVPTHVNEHRCPCCVDEKSQIYIWHPEYDQRYPPKRLATLEYPHYRRRRNSIFKNCVCGSCEPETIINPALKSGSGVVLNIRCICCFCSSTLYHDNSYFFCLKCCCQRCGHVELSSKCSKCHSCKEHTKPPRFTTETPEPITQCLRKDCDCGNYTDDDDGDDDGGESLRRIFDNSV